MKTDAIKTSAFTTKNIVYIGLMISVSVVLKLIFEVYIPVGGFASLRINFTSIPIMLSGVLFGPVAGLITGTVSDLLCFVIKPAGPFFPGFTISSALTGFIPGVIYMLISKNKAKKMNYSLVNSIFVLVLSAGVVAFFFSQNVLSIEDGSLLFQGEILPAIGIVFYLVVVAGFLFLPLFLNFSKGKGEEEGLYSLDKFFLTVSITNIVTSVILNTWFISMLFGQGYLAFLPARIITNFVTIPLFALILYNVKKFINIKN